MERNEEKVAGFKNSVENSTVQLVYGKNSLILYENEDLIEEIGESYEPNSMRNDDENIIHSASHSDDSIRNDDDRDNMQIIYGKKSVTFRDENALIEFAGLIL